MVVFMSLFLEKESIGPKYMIMSICLTTGTNTSCFGLSEFNYVKIQKMIPMITIINESLSIINTSTSDIMSLNHGKSDDHDYDNLRL